jgi:hypothetical protein
MPQSGIGLGEVKMRIRISQRWRVLLAGLSAGLIGVLVTLTPLGSGLEEQVGLSGMFLLRGSIAAPENTLIVSIDRQATDALGLPLHPAAWSRQVHADLVRRLSDAGARVVVYDLFFGQPRDEGGDTAFAESIREAGNVVLLQRLEATNVAIDGPQGERQGDLIFEEPTATVAILDLQARRGGCANPARGGTPGGTTRPLRRTPPQPGWSCAGHRIALTGGPSVDRSSARGDRPDPYHHAYTSRSRDEAARGSEP